LNNNYDDEMAVAVTLINEPSLLMTTDLSGDDFIYPEARGIFQTVTELEAMSVPVDAITVAQHMEKAGLGTMWIKRFSELMQLSSPGNFKAYAKHLKEQAQVRAVHVIAKQLAESAAKGVEAADEAIRALMGLSQTKRNFDHTLQAALTEATNDLERRMTGGELLGVKTGITACDNFIGGLHNSDLIIVGARPAMGKTAFMLNLALNADAPVGIISAEQGMMQMGGRVIAIDGRVNTGSMRSGKLNDDDFSRMTVSYSKLRERVIQFYDKPAPTLQDIVRQARKWKHNLDIKALYIDYIQRIKVDGSAPRHEQIGNVAMGLKELARELDIPVIALAQINRTVEARQNRRPQMGDLKDSGVIEQEADVIAMLYRDEVYDEKTEHKGIAEVDIKKNRHGGIGIIRTIWRAEFLRFEDIATEYNGCNRLDN
jgi:replicative DNA helicase